jgi:ABC-type nitrate/sulfonate/bicarbonate transport system substrate-binding protein
VRLFATIATILAVGACLSACGDDTGDRPGRDATLLLDFTPNAIHAGIYSALARGYDEAEGVTL